MDFKSYWQERKDLNNAWDYYEKIFKKFNSDSKLFPPPPEDFLFSDKMDPINVRIIGNYILFCCNWDIAYIEDLFDENFPSEIKDLEHLIEIIDKTMSDDFDFANRIDDYREEFIVSSLKEIFNRIKER